MGQPMSRVWKAVSGSLAARRGGRSWRRRLPLYLLFAGMAALAVTHLERQPVEVHIDYHYGQRANRLESATLRYRRDGHLAVRVRFNYQASSPPTVQRHSVRLPRGIYDVAIELRYRQPKRGAPQPSPALPSVERVVSLRRTLPVQGEGRVDLFVDAQ